MSQTVERRFSPDTEEKVKMSPAACPWCGHDGAFDGQGQWGEVISTRRSGVRHEYDVVWDAFRCPTCNVQFQMIVESDLISNPDALADGGAQD